jgi:hypothetical protein
MEQVGQLVQVDLQQQDMKYTGAGTQSAALAVGGDNPTMLITTATEEWTQSGQLSPLLDPGAVVGIYLLQD